MMAKPKPLHDIHLLAAVRLALLEIGFVETGRNVARTSFYFRLPNVQFRLRVSLHKWPAECHAEFPDVVLSWVLNEPTPAPAISNLAAKIGRAFIDASARRYLEAA